MNEMENAGKHQLNLTERKRQIWRPKRRGLRKFSRILKEMRCEDVRRGSGLGLMRPENSKMSLRIL